ncbi:hypothetical protein BSKO_06132 [Bryopsis sp. KO-2023]|nr:hypothetical protein BSKO_06132 [Bryopsis sp. KO-2023]
MTQANGNEPGQESTNPKHHHNGLLARNAKVIFALNELCKSRRGATPSQFERDLWLEAYRNLATVVSGIPPKDLLGDSQIQPYLDWAWKSGIVPSPYLGHPQHALHRPHAPAPVSEPPNPLFQAGIEGGDARGAPASEGLELDGGDKGAAGVGDPSGDGDGDDNGNGNGNSNGTDNGNDHDADETNPCLVTENSNDACFISTGIVNVVSPLARGPGTSPVIVGGSYASVPEGK